MKKLTSCIVKIIANNVTMDWFKPYKTDNETESIGTGFFIDNDGYIITCSHVVVDAIKIWITIPSIGKERIEAKVVGICDHSDIALLKTINYKPNSFMKLGNSDTILPGTKVIAIGYPLGQDRLKQTSGIISGRQDSNFQTDSPINPGNSGGPLVTENFEVIGINSSKIMFADNIGYAKPIYQFIIIDSIMRRLENNPNKMVYKPGLFANFNNSSEDLINYYNNMNGCKYGYYVKKVHPMSVLKKGNIESGDIISGFGKSDNVYQVDNYGECNVSWNNEKVHIYDIMQRYTLEDTIEIHFWKKNKKDLHKSKIVLGDMKIPQIRLYYPKYDNIEYVVFGGLIVMELTGNHLQSLFSMDLTRKMADHLSLYAHLKNKYEKILIITQIFPGSHINKLESLNQGDILSKVNNIKIKTLDEYRNALLDIKEVNNKKYIKYESKLNTLVICNLQKLLEEESFLSSNFKYKIDPIFDQFVKKYPEYKNIKNIKKQYNPNISTNLTDFNNPNIQTLSNKTLPTILNQFKQYNIEQSDEVSSPHNYTQIHKRNRITQDHNQPQSQPSEYNVLEQLKNIFLNPNPVRDIELENTFEPVIYDNENGYESDNEIEESDNEIEKFNKNEKENESVKQNVKKYINQFRRKQKY